MVGVTYRKDTNIWYCQIRIHGTKSNKYIGWAKTELEAKKIYDWYIIDNKLTHKYPLNFPREKPIIKKRGEFFIEEDQPDIPPALF